MTSRISISDCLINLYHMSLSRRLRTGPVPRRWFVTALLALVLSPPAFALKNDTNAPATIDADDVELDFKTGERVYSGNVFVRQGSMELTCNKLVATFKDDQLAVATAYGSAENLAIFKQRPEGKTTDVIGKAITMVLDQIEQLVTLSDNASLTQGTDTVTGNKILYDLELEKMRVKGSQTTIQKPTGDAPAKDKAEEKAEQNTGANTDEPAATGDDTAASDAVEAGSESTNDAKTTEAASVAAATDATATTETEAADTLQSEQSEQTSGTLVVPNDKVLSRGTTGRPRIIIQPRSKRGE